jgi:hypothetical protein
MNSFKRLSPYIGPNIPEQVRQNAKDVWYNMPPDYDCGWKWSGGSGTYQCELVLCDMETIDPAGYVAIVPLEDLRIPFRIEGERKRCWIRCVLDDEKFQADEEILTSKIFNTFQQAKSLIDSVLAFDTPEIPEIPEADLPDEKL